APATDNAPRRTSRLWTTGVQFTMNRDRASAVEPHRRLHENGCSISVSSAPRGPAARGRSVLRRRTRATVPGRCRPRPALPEPAHAPDDAASGVDGPVAVHARVVGDVVPLDVRAQERLERGDRGD